MPVVRGHRKNLEDIGTELNIVPYLDIMVNLVMFMLLTITSFISFTVLNASIPQLATDSTAVIEKMNKAQLLLVVRITRGGFEIDPTVQGGPAAKRATIAKKAGAYDYALLMSMVETLKQRFPDETRVLMIAEPEIIYDDVIQTMDALREKEVGKADLFPDVTLSIL